MEKESCRNCRNIDFNRKEILEGRLAGKYRYGCKYCKSGYICGVLSHDEKLEMLVCQGYSGNRQQADDMKSIAQSYEERLQELYDRWNLWRQTGALEAELSDGIYLNNLRKGIEAFLRQIEKALPEEHYPECYYSPLPPVMDESYMANEAEIKETAGKALDTYRRNPDYQWLQEHYCELQNDDRETGEAYRLFCHEEVLEQAIKDGDLVKMKRESCQEGLAVALAMCRKRMEKKLRSGKRKRGKSGEKAQITGQLDIAGLKVS